jgi:hypothetical protein
MIKRVDINVITAFLLAMFSACKKDKVPTPTPTVVEKSKFELIPGEYRMYDTLGNYLGYDMTITHWFGINDQGFRKDTFLFENFDGCNLLSYNQCPT